MSPKTKSQRATGKACGEREHSQKLMSCADNETPCRITMGLQSGC